MEIYESIEEIKSRYQEILVRVNDADKNGFYNKKTRDNIKKRLNTIETLIERIEAGDNKTNDNMFRYIDSNLYTETSRQLHKLESFIRDIE